MPQTSGCFVNTNAETQRVTLAVNLGALEITWKAEKLFIDNLIGHKSQTVAITIIYIYIYLH